MVASWSVMPSPVSTLEACRSHHDRSLPLTGFDKPSCHHCAYTRIHSCAVTQCSGNTKGDNDNPAAQYTPEQVQVSGWFENQMKQVDFILASSGPMADLRASLGHPQPYNMSMLALGNEVLLLPVACCPETQISRRQCL